MRHALSLAFALTLCAVAQAAEPTASASNNPSKPSAASSSSRAAQGKSLDLRIGDIRRYVLPGQYRGIVLGYISDSSNDTVVVEGKRESMPWKSHEPPPGIFAPFWAIAHPLQSWRILAPELNAPAASPTYDKVPPPVFRWGP